jgi:hypothetical protein
LEALLISRGTLVSLNPQNYWRALIVPTQAVEAHLVVRAFFIRIPPGRIVAIGLSDCF